MRQMYFREFLLVNYQECPLRKVHSCLVGKQTKVKSLKRNMYKAVYSLKNEKEINKLKKDKFKCIKIKLDRRKNSGNNKIILN